MPEKCRFPLRFDSFFPAWYCLIHWTIFIRIIFGRFTCHRYGAVAAFNDGCEQIHDVAVSLLGVVVNLAVDIAAVKTGGSVDSLELLIQQPGVVVDMFLLGLVPGRATRLVHGDGSRLGDVGNFQLQHYG